MFNNNAKDKSMSIFSKGDLVAEARTNEDSERHFSRGAQNEAIDTLCGKPYSTISRSFFNTLEAATKISKSAPGLYCDKCVGSFILGTK
jgi:hypothetical protein